MVFEVVRRAQRRMLAQEAVRHAAYAASTALAAFVLLLLFGTELLNWRWLVLLPLAAAAGGGYWIWRRRPSACHAAQRVDRALGLADTLSTALYFSAGARQAPREIREAQWSQAERVAAGLDLRRAIPVRAPRTLYGTAALALAASGLFAIRYGFDRRLDLSAPLARIVQEKLGILPAAQAALERKNPEPRNAGRREELGIALEDSWQKGPGELDPATDAALETVDEPNVDNSKVTGGRPDAAKKTQPAQGNGENEGAEAEGFSANAGDQQSGDGRQGPGAGKNGQPGDKQGDGGNSSENSSLLSKFRDAMAGLMNRMRQQPGASDGKQSASGANKGQSKSRQGNGDQSGKQGQQAGEGQGSDAQGSQPGDDSQLAQNSQSGNTGESGQEPASKQPGSGIGRQDGSKDVKLAEQLAAMGKISEIIGKRSANVSGEVTVETQDNGQQLRTPYAQREARHASAGGEINRDEVPVALQAYVQQYFVEVRKQAAANAGTPRADARAKKRAEPKTPGL